MPGEPFKLICSRSAIKNHRAEYAKLGGERRPLKGRGEDSVRRDGFGQQGIGKT